MGACAQAFGSVFESVDEIERGLSGWGLLALRLDDSNGSLMVL